MNNKKNECKFCSMFDKNESVSVIDKPITKNDNYMSLASIGAIVEGWMLIIPKKHILSMRMSYKDIEFIKFTNDIIDKIKVAYNKKCIVFEHGSNHEGSIINCGTNHAHMHILPYEESLLLDIKKRKLNWINCTVEEIEELAKGNEYWFYAENVENIEKVRGYLHIVEVEESQFFRKIIAEKENCIEKFNYKEFEFTENVIATLEKISNQNN